MLGGHVSLLKIIEILRSSKVENAKVMVIKDVLEGFRV